VWIAISIVLAIVWRRPWMVVPAIVGVLGADVAANIGKLFIHRHRPFEHQIGPSERTHSFPSGHSAAAFAGAAILAHYVPRLRAAFYASRS